MKNKFTDFKLIKLPRLKSSGKEQVVFKTDDWADSYKDILKSIKQNS